MGRKGDRSKRDKRKKWSRSRKSEAPVESIPEDMRACIHRVPDTPLDKLHIIVDKARLYANCAFQEEVVRACLQRILDSKDQGARYSPRPEQVRTLRRLIFGKSDVLLIARTGFGKSLIFHAYTVLTGKITLQLIPLTKLGDEQMDDIRRLDGAKPCLLNARTRAAEKGLIMRIASGEFTHVLLGPEQASSRSFRKALKSPELQAQIGLVAIDECHLVTQWEKFRPAFTLLGQLRTILCKDIAWFGCSATLDDEAEQRVLDSAGFRSIGNGMYQTEVIRTSVDRPDVAICVMPLLRGKLDSWDALYFLLADAVRDGRASPSNIPKTIVFVDGRRSVHSAAAWAQDMLIRMTAEAATEHQYSATHCGSSCSVFEVVKTFTSTISEHDRDATYSEFQSSSSMCRIVFATTSLGMGINILDVVRVVVWKLPITKSLADAWQRIGRGGRGPGCTSIGYIFLPYWMFNTLASCRPGAEEAVTTRGRLLSKPRQRRNQLPTSRIKARSRLSQCTTPGDVSDVDDGPQDANTLDLDAQQPAPSSNEHVRYWTKTEMANRKAVPDSWMDMVNGDCHRRALLSHLGEDKLSATERQVVDPAHCCSKCNPALLPTIADPPTRPKPPGPPRAGTLAAFVVASLEEWASKQAKLAFGGDKARFPMPSGVYMERACRWELGAYCALPGVELGSSDTDILTFDSLCSHVPSLSTWGYRDDGATSLVQALPTILEESRQQYANHHKSAQARRNQRRSSLTALTASQQADADTLPPAVDMVAVNQRRDNELAEQVAMHAATCNSRAVVAYPPLNVGVGPATPHSHREFVDAFIASPDIAIEMPLGLSDSIQRGIDRLQRIRDQTRMPSPAVAASPLATEVAETLLNDTPSTCRKRGVGNYATPRAKRRADRDGTPCNQRLPLDDVTSSSNVLTIASKSSRGRKLKLSAKGKENYRFV